MRVLRDPASVNGPTGLTDNAPGLSAIIVTTSWSSDLDSRLSLPASLPARVRAETRERERERGGGKRVSAAAGASKAFANGKRRV
jgi:hypothetical protein